MSSDSKRYAETTIDASTQDSDGDQPKIEARLVLTLLHHPDGRRVGERAELHDLTGGLPIPLSRVQPEFRAVNRALSRPLEHQRLSRTPIWLRLHGDSISITPARADLRVKVDAQPIDRGRDIPLAQIRERGAFIALGGGVLIWLHELTGDSPQVAHGIHGVSSAIVALHHAVERVAQLPVPVLIRGESGVGKELVARALHQLSDRSQSPWVAVNMAAIPVSMAAAELFGHARGAFTGAEQSREGCFTRAHRGTLFLDEIGETPFDIQPQLLRALESSEIQPVGATSRKVDIRFIAATDADLQALVESGAFRRSLLHRLQAAVLHVPPLRERPADIPYLLHHFLREHLQRFDATDLLDGARRAPKQREWLRLSVITRLMRYSFPGNVRELRNLASQMAIHGHDQDHAAIPRSVEDHLTIERGDSQDSFSPGPAPAGTVAARSRQMLGRIELSVGAIREKLRQNQWNISRTARALGISKNSLVARIREIPDVRLARDLTSEEIRTAQSEHGTDMTALASALKVSLHGLRLRMRELDLL